MRVYTRPIHTHTNISYRKCEFFPLCIDCTTHNTYDCDFFCEGAAGAEISKNLLVENYTIFGVLKLLLLMENPANSEQCAALSATPGAAVVDSEAWQEQDAQIVTPLLQSGIARVFKRVKVTHELLHTLCWRIDANAFEVTASDGNTLKGVYACGAQLPHNCVPNTVVTFDEDFRLKLYASVRIPVGAVIYNTYTNPLMGTSQRQHELRLTKGIECACARCNDPLELGTHMSSLKCTKCANGFVVCSAPIRDVGIWKCNNCAATMATDVVKQLLVDVGEALLETNSELLAYESLLAKYSVHFHQNHFVLVEIKQNIASILRAILMNPMCIPGKDLLERKLQLCEEMMPLVRAVLPGVSKLYGIALYEYLLSYMELAELIFEEKAAANAAQIFQEKLEDARDIAAKAKEMLRFEPSNSPEGHLVSRIAMEQKRIEENLRQLNSKRSCA
uniref:Protein msta, isoform A n=1 Tax=Zeugodacus cucurbitae TaxID=28588 RepID=A0A0A1WXT0_ZEUCU